MTSRRDYLAGPAPVSEKLMIAREAAGSVAHPTTRREYQEGRWDHLAIVQACLRAIEIDRERWRSGNQCQLQESEPIGWIERD
ncbi:MAG: hypothetical protein KDK08_25565 [Rhizobiaceae bacterium]|nr:hypothetical protein [Rhizobiaceae bacterium]